MRKTERLVPFQDRVTIQPQLVWGIKLIDGLPCEKHTVTAGRLHVIYLRRDVNVQRWKLTQNQGQSDFDKIG